MRVTCPHCGTRDRREFTYQGDAIAMHRPNRDAGDAAWDDYLHNRDNPAGMTRDLWFHDPCGAWVVVTRDTRDHSIHATTLAEVDR